MVIISLGRHNSTHICGNLNKTPTLVFEYVFFQKIFLPTYQNILKTNGNTLTKLIYLVVHITRHILTIQRIRTTLSENWDHPVFLLKRGLNCPTTKFCWTIRTTLSDNFDHLVRQLEPPPLEG